MGYIYKITNDENGKVYIGKTARTVWGRWRNHVSHAVTHKKHSCPRLHRAIRKYGEDSFTCEPIQEAPDDVLNDLEKFWIWQYDSANKGYNITLGGEGLLKYEDKEFLEKWNSGMIVKEIAKSTGATCSTVSARLHALGIDKWEIMKRGKDVGSKKNYVPVYMYDLEGNYIRSFKSIGEGNAFIGLKNGVLPALSGYIKQSGGYQWRDYKVDKIEPYRPLNSQRRAVAKLADDGTVLEVFKRIIDAARATNCHHSNIIRACKNPWKTCGGFKWKYV